MLRTVSAFVFGLVFGIGILLSGMANPAKVLNFFDIAGTWDPSLMFVMGGALVITAIGYRLAFRMQRPLLASGFSLPTRKDLDGKLIAGSAIFGIGWGIAGFCPGGLIPALGLGRIEPIITAVAVIAGILSLRAVNALRTGEPSTSTR